MDFKIIPVYKIPKNLEYDCVDHAVSMRHLALPNQKEFIQQN